MSTRDQITPTALARGPTGTKIAAAIYSSKVRQSAFAGCAFRRRGGKKARGEVAGGIWGFPMAECGSNSFCGPNFPLIVSIMIHHVSDSYLTKVNMISYIGDNQS